MVTPSAPRSLSSVPLHCCLLLLISALLQVEEEDVVVMVVMMMVVVSSGSVEVAASAIVACWPLPVARGPGRMPKDLQKTIQTTNLWKKTPAWDDSESPQPLHHQPVVCIMLLVLSLVVVGCRCLLLVGMVLPAYCNRSWLMRCSVGSCATDAYQNYTSYNAWFGHPFPWGFASSRIRLFHWS